MLSNARRRIAAATLVVTGILALVLGGGATASADPSWETVNPVAEKESPAGAAPATALDPSWD